jgi:hypothetical protein
MLRMTKCRRAGLTLFGIALALAAYLVVASRPRLEAKLPRIEVGLTRTEVEAVLGKPQLELYPPSGRPTKSCSVELIYFDDRPLSPTWERLWVSFDDNGQVDNRGITRGHKPQPWERLRDRFAQLWASVGW